MQLSLAPSPARLLATALTCLLATAAQAQTTFQLRYLGLDTNSASNGAYSSADRFNNGNPLSGLVLQPLFNGNPNGAPQVGTYAATGTFAPGRELTGAASDFLGTTLGIGSLAYARSDAAATTSNLTPAGYTSQTVALRPVAPSATALGLVGRAQGFDFLSVWNYTALQPGEALFQSLGGSGGTNYVDRLQIRYGLAVDTGLPFVNFETQSSSGGVLTRTVLGSTTPSAIYANLGAVDYIGLSLSRDMPTTANPSPGVKASVVFFDAALDGTGAVTELTRYTFATQGQTFQGSGDFQGVFNAAAWITPVPEPTPAALLALGLGALLLRRSWKLKGSRS
jgi:hypothetical protein